MKKVNLLFVCLLSLLSVLVLTACQPDKPTGDPNAVAPNTEVHTLEDTRPEAYEVHTADGELVDSFASLYDAIYSCVNEGDTLDYVTKVGEETKVFINYDQYTEATKDMFWYYDQGASLIDYKAWESTYWQITRDYGQAIAVHKSGEYGEVAFYGNSYDIVAKNENLTDYDLEAYPGSTAVWNVSWLLEASATVDMAPYSGITKAVYTIDLSEAMISPSLATDTKAWAYVGFMTCDANNLSNMGLRCDTTTGNWYYYSGETDYNANDIEIDDDTCYLTSTWDSANNCFRPDGDVTLTCELLTVEDDGDEYIVHRLTMDFGNGRVVTKDYELPELTTCGTIRFTSGLDLESDRELQDYMCGASFKNLVVTSAKATIYEENTVAGKVFANQEEKDAAQDAALESYGNFAAFPAGDYDILNSNPATLARFHTIIYTPSVVTTDFTTPGKDVYSYEYKCTSNLPALGGRLKETVDAINAIPAVTDLTADSVSLITEARDLYEGLSDSQKDLVTNYDHLLEAEENMDVVAIIPLNYTGQNGPDNFFDGQATYDKATKTYKLEIELIVYGRIKFSFDGEALNPTNTTITGKFTNAGSADWTENLYIDAALDPSTLLSCTGGKYTFIFNPETNTLDISVYTPETGENQVAIKKTNADSELSVWTEAGTKFRTVSSVEDSGKVNYSWLGNGWRLYIVCDSEGKVMYAVCMPPNGYGGPSGDGYVVHADYADYTTNGAFNILEGYGPWTSENPNPSNLYEVLVPEGGFAITCYGESMRTMITLLSEGAISYGESVDSVLPRLNSNDGFSDNMRISYDTETQLVTVTKVGE